MRLLSASETVVFLFLSWCLIDEVPIDNVQDIPPLSSDSHRDDVSMAAHPYANGLNGTNGSHFNGDVVMKDDSSEAPAAADASMTSIDEVPSPNGSRERPSEGYDDDEQPPAKRPRMLSDADKASMTHVSSLSLSCAVTGVLIPRLPPLF